MFLKLCSREVCMFLEFSTIKYCSSQKLSSAKICALKNRISKSRMSLELCPRKICTFEVTIDEIYGLSKFLSRKMQNNKAWKIKSYTKQCFIFICSFFYPIIKFFFYFLIILLFIRCFLNVIVMKY